MRRGARAAVIVAVMLLSAPVAASLPGGLWWLVPLAAALWWVDKQISKASARDRWLELDCAAAIRGSHRRPEAARAAMDRHKWSPQRQVLLRHLQVFGESAHLVRNSKSPTTVSSRRRVAQQAMSDAIALRGMKPRAEFWRHLERHAADL